MRDVERETRSAWTETRTGGCSPNNHLKSGARDSEDLGNSFVVTKIKGNMKLGGEFIGRLRSEQ